MKLILKVCVLVLLSACCKSNRSTLDFNTFTIDVPCSWIKIENNPKQEFNGTIRVSKTRKIQWLVGQIGYCVTPEPTLHIRSSFKINEKEAVLIRPKVQGKGMYLLTISDLGKNRDSGLLLESNNLTAEEELQFIEAIKSIRINDEKL